MAPLSDGTGSLFASARIISLSTLASRVLGLARDMLSMRLFGTAGFSGFLWAWTLPNLFRRFLGEGALSAAFVPAFCEKLERGRTGEMWQLSGVVLGGLLLATSLITVLGVALVLSLPSAWLSPFFDDLASARSTRELVAWMLPYVSLICTVGFLQGILNSLGHFAAPALAPLALNAFWIAGLLFVVPLAGGEDTQGSLRALALTLLAGGLVQVGMQVPPLLRRGGAALRPAFRPCDPELRRILARMGPMLLGLSAVQIHVVFDRAIAQMVVGEEANSVLFVGNRLMQLPLALIGTALATAALPALSRLRARGHPMELSRTLTAAMRVVCHLAFPSAVGLAVVAQPGMELFFAHGAFTHGDARGTAHAIMAYGAGLPAACSILLLARAYFALGDTRTPMRLAASLVLVNLVLDLVFVWPLGAAGTALATSLTSWIQACFLLRWLRGRIPALGRELGRSAVVAVVGSGLMGLVCLASLHLTGGLTAEGGVLGFRALRVVLPVVVGVACYGAVLRLGDPGVLSQILHQERRGHEA